MATPAKAINFEKKFWFKTYIRAPLLPHLERWQKRTGAGLLPTFVAEIVEVGILEWIRNEPEPVASGGMLLGKEARAKIRPRTNDLGDAHKLKISPSHEKKIRRLLTEGLPIAQIAIRFAIAQSTVRRIYERARWERENTEEL
jgi:hypothetical protein